MRRVAETLQQPEDRARVWLAIAKHEADRGDRERALAAVDHVYATARVMPADETGAKVLAAAADLYRRVGAPVRAAEVRRLAQQRAEGIERPQHRAAALEAIAASDAKAGESESAERLLAQAVALLDPDQRAYWDVSARLTWQRPVAGRDSPVRPVRGSHRRWRGRPRWRIPTTAPLCWS